MEGSIKRIPIRSTSKDGRDTIKINQVTIDYVACSIALSCMPRFCPRTANDMVKYTCRPG